MVLGQDGYILMSTQHIDIPSLLIRTLPLNPVTRQDDLIHPFAGPQTHSFLFGSCSKWADEGVDTRWESEAWKRAKASGIEL